MTDQSCSVGFRWTIGDVSNEGFEALRLSVWGAWSLMDAHAVYAICVNSIPLPKAQQRTGLLPPGVRWIDANALLPHWLRAYFDSAMAEGVGWKLAPLRVFPDRYEIALDNDCILWQMPYALRAALADPHPHCVVAEDVRACFGQFASLCGSAPRNSGIRGLPPGFDLERALLAVLQRCPCFLSSETDEQGLQIAALTHAGQPLVVAADEVSICSPFAPHTPALGSCGAHFVGLNARNLPWSYYGQPASEARRAHWRERRWTLYELIGIKPDERHADR